MHSRKRWTGVCLVLLVAGDGLADNLEIEEIVVTASRRDLPAERVSFATADYDLATPFAGTVVTDAFAAVPGVALQQTTPGQGAALVRGQRGSSVLHLVDGVRLNNALFRSAPTQYFAFVPVSAASRIEVVRGTPTSLYGSDAVGGVVQLITHQPSFELNDVGSTGYVDVVANSAEQQRGARARVDIGHRTLAASLAAEFVATDDRRIGGGERVGPSDVETRAVRAWFGYTPTPDRRWSLDLQYAEQPGTPRVDELVAGFGQAAPASAEFFFEPNRRSFVHAKYRQDEALLGADFNVSLAWQRIDDDRRSRDTGSNERRLESNRSDLAGLTATLARTMAQGSWVAGAEFYHDDVASTRTAVDITTGTRVSIDPRFPDGAQLSQAALFVHGEYLFGERHTFSGGVRVSRVDIDVPSTPTITAARIGITDPSGDIAYRYAVSAHLDVVVNAGVGFRAPNVFDLGALGDRPGNRFNIPNTDLDSEAVINVDAGLRWRSERLTAELTLFRLTYDDRIVSVPTGQQTAAGRDIVRSENLADVDVLGAEAALQWTPAEAWQIDATLTATRGEQSRLAGGDEPGDRIPPYAARLAARYSPGERWSALAVVSAARRQQRLSDRDVADPRIDPLGTPGWVRIDFGLDYRVADDWLLNLRAENITDRRYRLHGSGIDAVGRNLAVSFRYDW